MGGGRRIGPWRLLASRPVYRNDWISVREDRVLKPRGGEGIYGVVSFAHTAIGVVALDGDACVWLVGQHRYPLDQYAWEIPEGGCPRGESPLAGARRELAEETGLRASHWQALLELDLSNSVTDERAIVYLAQGLTQGPAAPEDSEELDVRRLPFDQALDWVWSGRIRDAISVAALTTLACRRTEFGL